MVDILLKTRQLAELLNVSVSSIKRWVDLGELPATRTVGGHRLVSLSGAIKFALARDLPTRQILEFARESMDSAPQPVTNPPTWEELAVALKRDRSASARDLLVSSYATFGGSIALADELIRPAMEALGHDWERGSLDVYQEHRASRMVESALMELLRTLPVPAADSPLAIGAAPEGDLYTLPGLLAELTLRELGWDVVNLGPNLPLTSLGRAVRIQQPRLVWLSVSFVKDEESFLHDYHSFYASASMTETAVVLGGSALTPALRARLVAASFGDRMAHLREFAKRLHPRVSGPNTFGTMDRPGSTQP